MWRADAETARQRVGDLFGLVERLTNALATCFLVLSPGGSATGLMAGTPHGGSPSPTEPDGRLLTTWWAIITLYNEGRSEAGRLTHNERGHKKFRRLNDRFKGPVLFGGQGKQPHVNESMLRSWLHRIASTSPNIDTESQKVAIGRRRKV